jgi:hypothetical protein
MIAKTFHDNALIKGAYMGTTRPHYPLRELAEIQGFDEVTLMAGEDLYDLAIRIFGEGNEDLWYVLAESNPLRDPTDYKAGDVVRVPRVVSVQEEAADIKNEISTYGI